jgi:hypothetical protein
METLTMAAPLFEQHRVIDIDTHVNELPGGFPSRITSKWRDDGAQTRDIAKVLHGNAAVLYGVA